MNYVLWPIAHGVEFDVIQQDYAAPLIESVRANLSDEEKNYLVPLPYNYTLRTNQRQLQMFNAVEAGLGNQELRRLKHTVGSDVTWSFIIAKQDRPCFAQEFVQDVCAIISNGLNTYGKNSKILCAGHSQGSQNFYSFFFEYSGVIDCFVSLGSPISMNSGAWDDWGMVPPNLKSWINFYHDLDFVSSRIQGVHPSKAIADFAVDYKIPNGLNPLFWFPHFKIAGMDSRIFAGLKAHISYWKSQFVAKIIAEKVSQLIHQP